MPPFVTDCVFALWSARDGILQPESKDDEMEHFVDVPDEDSADVALDTTPLGPNSETNGASEDSGESDSDAEHDMVDRSFPGLADDGNDSTDEEGDKKRTARKGSKIPKLKTSVVGREVSLAESPIPNASEEPGQKTWPVEGYYDSRHRDPSYWYDE